MSSEDTTLPDPQTTGAADEARTEVPPTEPAAGQADPKPRTKRKSSPATKRRKQPAAAKRTPPASAPAAKAPRAPSVAQLRQQRANAIAELLCLPAIPATMVGHMPMASHFTTVGPITAHRLAELAEQSPEIARVIDKASDGNVMLGLVLVAAGYLGPAVLFVMGRAEQGAAASGAVQMMNASPGTLAAMMASMSVPEDPDDDLTAVPPFDPPAAGPSSAL